MLKISNKKLEKAFNKRIKKSVVCLGVDTASRTGWCKAVANDKECTFDYGFINVNSKDKYFKYSQYIEILDGIISKDEDLIIEETFCGINIKSFQLLSRLGGFVYAVAHLKGVQHKKFILATTARKFLGFKGNAKKEIIQKQFIKKLGIEIDDEDVIDAIILALNGILEERTLL